MASKLIFMGTPEFAVPILNTIHNSEHKILCVYTQPPKKKNRGQKIYSSPVQQYADRTNLKLRSPSDLNEKEYQYIKNLKPQIVIVVAYGKILPKKILDLNNVEFLNIHASLLPKWRGAAPIQRSIMNLDNETGVSIMKIIPKLDAGPVMMKSKIKISKDSDFLSLSKELSVLGADMILKSLDSIEKNSENFIDQVEREATYAKKIDKKESKIEWNTEAKNIIAKINALYPTPGSWFQYKGSRLKIIKAVEVEKEGRPGEIIDKKFTIACSKNAIQILELQKEGKKSIDVSEYLKGNILETGFNVS